jgi:thiol-disulfide isomerase/thioredoxin
VLALHGPGCWSELNEPYHLLFYECFIYSLVEPISFKAVQEDQRTKVVIFTGTSEKSASALATFTEISNMEEFGDYAFVHIDVPTDEDAKSAFPEEALPLLFTATPEDGVARLGDTLDLNSFREFHQFRVMTFEDDNVIRFESESQISELAQTKPVFLKMYEEWCGHCKKLKKHYQGASMKSDKVHWVEVECSVADGFCEKLGVEGFPTLKIVNVGATKVAEYQGGRSMGDLVSVIEAGNFDYTADISFSSASGHDEL